MSMQRDSLEGIQFKTTKQEKSKKKQITVISRYLIAGKDQEELSLKPLNWHHFSIFMRGAHGT